MGVRCRCLVIDGALKFGRDVAEMGLTGDVERGGAAVGGAESEPAGNNVHHHSTVAADSPGTSGKVDHSFLRGKAERSGELGRPADNLHPGTNADPVSKANSHLWIEVVGFQL